MILDQSFKNLEMNSACYRLHYYKIVYSSQTYASWTSQILSYFSYLCVWRKKNNKTEFSMKQTRFQSKWSINHIVSLRQAKTT